MGEAVSILGMSASTIRRRIDAGELDAERVSRPQGTALLVKVPADQPPRITEASGTSQDAPGISHHVSGGTEHLAAIMGPLVAELAASRQSNERLVGRVAELERENGRQAAELERAAAAIVTLGDELAAERAKSTLTASTGPIPAGSAQEPPTARVWLSARWWSAGVAMVSVLVLLIGLVALVR